jgi:four helix bundle protein
MIGLGFRAESLYVPDVRDFHKLKVWGKAHSVTLEVYRVTKAFPTEERYGLTAQLRRAAASMSANLAEGSGRHTSHDFARFLDIALGSASELEYHLLLSADLTLIDRPSHAHLNSEVVQVKRMIAGLLRKLRPDS